MFNLFPGLSSVTNAVPANGIFPTNVFDQKHTEGSQTSGLLSQATGLLSQTSGLLSGGALDWPTPKPPILWDASFKQLVLAILLRLLSFMRGFIPPFVWGLFLLGIPPFVSFYEITLRRFFPQLPSMFAMALKLYKSGLLTISTLTWLLPQGMFGGLSVVGGVAMGGTAAFVGGATAGASVVVGGVTGLAGGAAQTISQGIHILNPTTMATDIAQVVSGGQGVATNGLNGAVNLVGGAAKGIAEGISLIQSGEIEVAQNVAHLLSGEHGAGALVPTVADDIIQATVGNTNAIAQEVIQATVGNTSAVAKGAVQAAMGTTNAITGAAIQSVTHPVAAIGATQAAVTENAAKLAHALDSVNPLSNLIPSQQGVLGNMLHPKLPGFV